MSYALTALLVFCLIAWGFVLVPPAIRLLSGVVRPSDSIGSFRTKMAVLAGSTPGSLGQGPVPELAAPADPAHQVLDFAAHRRTHVTQADRARRRAAKARRRNIFTGLLASVPVTFLLAVVAGGPAWVLFMLSMVAFGGYTALLWQMQQTALERRRKVAVLPATAQPTVAQGELRRVSIVGR